MANVCEAIILICDVLLYMATARPLYPYVMCCCTGPLADHYTHMWCVVVQGHCQATTLMCDVLLYRATARPLYPYVVCCCTGPLPGHYSHVWCVGVQGHCQATTLMCDVLLYRATDRPLYSYVMCCCTGPLSGHYTHMWCVVVQGHCQATIPICDVLLYRATASQSAGGGVESRLSRPLLGGWRRQSAGPLPGPLQGWDGVHSVVKCPACQWWHRDKHDRLDTWRPLLVWGDCLQRWPEEWPGHWDRHHV